MTDYSSRVNERRLILGPKDNLMAISPMKHKWAREIWQIMLQNNWTAQEVDLSRDVACYKEKLTDAERFMYDKALAFLSNLDGIQFNNLTQNIGHHITSPEVSMLIARQAFEEALHVDAYSSMIEAISLDPMSVYMTFERDGLLAAKNEHILRQSAALGTEFSPRAFALAVVSNILLEGIYFFSGFLAFYLLARNGKMLGSCDMIRLIQRDEEGTHLKLFVAMLETLKVEHPEVFDAEFYEEAGKLFRDAVDLESAWGRYIIKGGVLGATDQIVDDYIRTLANERAALVGMFPPYPGVKNPVPWVKKFSAVNGVETNFFEGKVSSYAVGGALEW
jgi:ribonucleoside-diphosphate reductase beta chain